MGLIIKLAWRSVWRNWRRSLLTMLAILFAVFLSVFQRGMQVGSYEKYIESAAGIFTGYMQIQREGFKDSPTLQKSFVLTPELEKAVLSTVGVTGAAPRIQSFGLVGFDRNSKGCALFGLDPQREIEVSSLHKKIVKGDYISDKDVYGVVVGEKLLKNLGASVGDTIVILSSGYDGSTGNAKFVVRGASKIGSVDFDNASIFMHIDAAKILFSMDGRVSSLAISVESINVMEDALANIKEKINSGNLKEANLVALDWGEVMPELKQSIEFDNVSGILFLAILIVVVAFGILNTILTSVTERFREFGVMLALGTKNGTLLAVVFFETLILTFMGMIGGMILGWIGNTIVINNPIPLPAESQEMVAQIGFEPYMYSSIQPIVFISNAIAIFATSMIAFIYPGIRLLNLEPLKGVRHT